MTQSSTPPGWYDDGHGSERYWDGSQWTDQTRTPGGSAGSAGAAPASPSSPAAPDVTQVAPGGSFGAPYTPPAQGTPSQGTPSQGVPGYQAPPPPGNQPSAPGAPPWQQPGQPSWQGADYAGPSGPGGSGGSGGGKGLLIGLVAGGAVIVILFLVLLFTVVLGGGSPENVAEDYLEAQAKADVEKLCELSTEAEQKSEFETYDVDNCGDYIDALEDDEDAGYAEYREYAKDVDADIEIGKIDEKDDSATVKYTETLEYTGDDEDLADQYGDGCVKYKGTVELEKEDGDWKVANDDSESSEC